MKFLKYFLSITFVYTLSFSNIFAQQNDTSLYNRNIQLAKKLYESNIIGNINEKQNLTQNDKDALILAVYYDFSQKSLTIAQMKEFLSKYESKDYSKQTDEQVETDFYKLIDTIDNSLYHKDFSYLKTYLN